MAMFNASFYIVFVLLFASVGTKVDAGVDRCKEGLGACGEKVCGDGVCGKDWCDVRCKKDIGINALHPQGYCDTVASQTLCYCDFDC